MARALQEQQEPVGIILRHLLFNFFSSWRPTIKQDSQILSEQKSQQVLHITVLLRVVAPDRAGVQVRVLGVVVGLPGRPHLQGCARVPLEGARRVPVDLARRGRAPV